LSSKSPLLDLSGIGEKTLENLKNMGIENLKDFLFYLPKGYQDRTKITLINNLTQDQACLVDGIILDSRIIMARRRMLICEIEDDSGALLTLRFFHFNQAQKNQFIKNKKIRVFGTPKRFQYHFEMIHPEYKVYDLADRADTQVRPYMGETGPWRGEPCVRPSRERGLPLETQLTPIYSLPDGVFQNKFRSWIKKSFELIKPEDLEELLPEELKKSWSFPSLYDALRFIHEPSVGTDFEKIIKGDHPMIHRLIVEELLAHSLFLLNTKSKIKKEKSPICQLDLKLKNSFLSNILFKPTGAQERVLLEILEDLKQPSPMLRLLQGDVGSGKTWVAALSALCVISSGYQVALMAPTEILAKQHFKNLSVWFGFLNIKTVLLISKQTGKLRSEVYAQVKTGEAKLIIGTQALFQEGLDFSNLGLVIVDEQHRFGVLQRKALLEKGTNNLKPHQLIMTATPIPRTLAMTVYADLDVSILDELPPGRIPIKTILINSQKRAEIIERVFKYIEQGHQVYWVCTLIDESEVLESEAAVLIFELLKQEIEKLSLKIRINLIHGKLKPAEKNQIMEEFSSGEINILVATTVIEVGVDVPNASVMVIENSERLGLSQLHQLRGRVGRGSTASYCVLLYQTPLSQTARARLEAMRETTDGFILAEKDLELRGPGEFLGTKQTGEMSFRFADLARDRAWLPKIHQGAVLLWESYPEQAQKIMDRWLKSSADLAEV